MKGNKTLSAIVGLLMQTKVTFENPKRKVKVENNEDELNLNRTLSIMESRNPSYSEKRVQYSLNEHDRVGVDFETNQPKFKVRPTVMPHEQLFYIGDKRDRDYEPNMAAAA